VEAYSDLERRAMKHFEWHWGDRQPKKDGEGAFEALKCFTSGCSPTFFEVLGYFWNFMNLEIDKVLSPEFTKADQQGAFKKLRERQGQSPKVQQLYDDLWKVAGPERFFEVMVSASPEPMTEWNLAEWQQFVVHHLAEREQDNSTGSLGWRDPIISAVFAWDVWERYSNYKEGCVIAMTGLLQTQPTHDGRRWDFRRAYQQDKDKLFRLLKQLLDETDGFARAEQARAEIRERPDWSRIP
jgi:hypothetical protein